MLTGDDGYMYACRWEDSVAMEKEWLIRSVAPIVQVGRQCNTRSHDHGPSTVLDHCPKTEYSLYMDLKGHVTI